MLYLAFFLGVLLTLIIKKDELILLESNIFNFSSRHEFSYKILIALCFPVFILYLIFKSNSKMSNKFLKSILIITLVFVALGYLFSSFLTNYNKSVDLKTEFTFELKQRGKVLDEMNVNLSRELQIAGINDSSYSRNLREVAFMRKDEGVFWKWVQENNPNANYSEVSALYNKLFNNVSIYRESLSKIENNLGQISKNWELLHSKFPSKIFLMYQPSTLDYNPITTLESQQINRTNTYSDIKIK